MEKQTGTQNDTWKDRQTHIERHMEKQTHRMTHRKTEGRNGLDHNPTEAVLSFANTDNVAKVSQQTSRARLN